MIGVVFEREDGSTYQAELEPTWRLFLEDGRIINAEDVEVGDRVVYSGAREERCVQVALKVMDE